MSKNDITGDEIKSRINTKAFEENFDRIFRKKPIINDDIFPTSEQMAERLYKMIPERCRGSSN